MSLNHFTKPMKKKVIQWDFEIGNLGNPEMGKNLKKFSYINYPLNREDSPQIKKHLLPEVQTIYSF